MKKCSKCGEKKDESEFHNAPHHSDGLSSQCKACRKIYFDAYRERTKEKQKIRHKKYYDANREIIREKANKKFHTCPRRKRQCWALRGIDMTVERWNKMFAAQEGKCLLCGRHQTEFKQNLSVDHNHSTGKVRALLCSRCNLLVGQMEASPEIAKKVPKYLEMYAEKRTP